jgi:hypothetical protein
MMLVHLLTSRNTKETYAHVLQKGKVVHIYVVERGCIKSLSILRYTVCLGRSSHQGEEGRRAAN